MEKAEIATSPGIGDADLILAQGKGRIDGLDLEEFDFDYEQEEAED